MNNNPLLAIARQRPWYNRPLTWAFAILLCLIGLITSLASISLQKIETEILDDTLVKTEKLRLLDEMVHHSRQRSVLLRDLVLADDPFDQDEIIQKHSVLASKYLAARTALDESPLSSEEQAILNNIIETNKNGYDLQQQIKELASTGHLDEAQNLIANELGPNREMIYPEMMKMREILVYSSNDSVYSAAQLLSRYRNTLNWLLVVAILIGFFIAWLAYRQEARHNQRLIWQACHDPLTGLGNRYEAEININEMINDAQESGSQHAMLYVDVDQFNVINNTSGQSAGDELLRQITTSLKSLVGDEMRIDRVGSDQFVILLKNMDIEQARAFARKVLDEVSENRFDWSDRSYDITASAGVVPINETTGSYQEIWSDAYFACDLAKEQGGDRVQVSIETSHETRKRREGMDWATRLRRAMKEDRLILYRQGIASLRRNTVHSEILLRYQDEDGQIIPAAKFIPAAERYNLITEIDFYVVKKALQYMAAEPEANSYSINLSGMSLGNRDLLDLIITELDQNQVDAERVCFEITETAAIRNHTDAVQFMNVLHGIGCHFFLDDFGTGLSSFGYLKTLPLDMIKVDAHFIQSIETEEASRSIIQAITTIAHGFGIKTVAEGVENEHQLAILGALGIDYVQGYLIEKPARLMAA